ncbi:uncharacterized protein LOC117242433 [Bombus vosnesenskii]|uniref:Uncharacterized protein LOC117242433 n=1 Tax=Bombus vosnesenskii TaxID=207650 RepID=A0A6J3LI91_9HYME|nr:uncharacterized protein LOC117242433 [Bombus vosnesenskii]
MTATAIAIAWLDESSTDEDAEAGSTQMWSDVHAICDSRMPRSGAPRRAGAVYWCSEEIARLREACIHARRRYTRSRRWRRVDEATVARLYEAYREMRRPPQRVTKEAKRRAWDELLASLDSDPWGRPYKMVLNKLCPWAPPLTESMGPQFLEEVVGTLFPGAANEGDGSFAEEEEQEPQPPGKEPRVTAESWNPVSRVTEEELAVAVGRIGAQKAPGPDGVPPRLSKNVAGVSAPRLVRLFDGCLCRGYAGPSNFIPYPRTCGTRVSSKPFVAETVTGRAIHRGVPQGSVLGPLLWNIAYDAVLRTPTPPNSALACYDDTLVLSGARHGVEPPTWRSWRWPAWSLGSRDWD